MIKEIIQLLPEEATQAGDMGGFLSIVARYPRFCRSGSTDTDIAGSGKTRWRTGHDAGIVWCRVAVCIAEGNALVAFLARVQSRYQLEIYREFSRRMFANYYHRGLLFLKGKSSVQLGHEVNYVCYMFSSCVLAPVFLHGGRGSTGAADGDGSYRLGNRSPDFLLCASFLPLTGLYVGLVRKRLRRYGMEELEARRKQSRTVVEAYRGYAELEIARAFHTSLASFDQGMEFIVHNRLRMEVYQLFPFFLLGSGCSGGVSFIDWHWKW